MIRFNIIKDEVPQPKQGWLEAPKLEGERDLVDENGKYVGKYYQGRRYKIVATHEHKYTALERIGRGFLGILFAPIVLIANALTLMLLDPIVAARKGYESTLFSKMVHLFTDEKTEKRYAKLFSTSIGLSEEALNEKVRKIEEGKLKETGLRTGYELASLLEKAPAAKDLKILDLRNLSKLFVEDMKRIVIAAPNITAISFPNCAFSLYSDKRPSNELPVDEIPSYQKAFMCLGMLSKLKELSFGWNFCDNNLGDLSHLRGLEKLDLAGSNVVGLSLYRLRTLPNLKILKLRYLRDNTRCSFSLVGFISDNRGLERLISSNNKLTRISFVNKNNPVDKLKYSSYMKYLKKKYPRLEVVFEE